MILPTKHLPVERSMIGAGAQILQLLDQPKTVSTLWLEFQSYCETNKVRLTFDWFTLTLSMLYSVDAVHLKGRRIHRCEAER